MTSRAARLLRRALALVGLFLLAAVVAPFLRMDRYRDQLERALSEALQRKVDIRRPIHLSLLTGVTLTADEVIIHDAPEAGIEPLAYVGQLQATLRPGSLLAGRLRLSTLRLVEPSLNLVRTGDNSWNVQPLLSRTVAAANTDAAGLPRILVENGRLNFKVNHRKLAFFVTDADFELAVAGHPQDGVTLRFSGQPARTDRPLAATGDFRAEGTWRPVRGGEGQLSLSLAAQSIGVAELVSLVHGDHLGLQGLVGANATLRGTLSNLDLRGRVQLANVRRWELLPTQGDGTLAFQGQLDLVGQRVSIASSGSATGLTPVLLSFGANSLFSTPRWSLSLQFNDFPAERLLPVARQVGIPLPKEAQVAAAVSGTVAYTTDAGLHGEVQLQQAKVRLEPLPPWTADVVVLSIQGTQLTMAPAAIRFGPKDTATVEAGLTLDAPGTRVRMVEGTLPLAVLRSAGALLNAKHPLLQATQDGRWNGSLEFAQSATETVWEGQGELRDARWPVEGLSEPLLLEQGNVRLQGERVAVTRLQAKVGALPISGEYRFEPGNVTPHRFRLATQKAALADLERLLAPTVRRSVSLIDRAFRRPSPGLPAWLRERDAEGSWRIAELDLGSWLLHEVDARLAWTGPVLAVSSVTARLEDAPVSGWATADLRRPVPQFQVRARLAGVPYLNGRMDAEGILESRGLGTEFLANMRLDGSFQARSLWLASDQPIRAASGCFRYSAGARTPQLQVESLQVSTGTDSFSGTGQLGLDRLLRAELTSGSRQWRLAGSVYPPQLELTPVSTRAATTP